MMADAVADWVEHEEGVALPAADLTPGDWGKTTFNPKIAERLNVLFREPQFKPYIDVAISLYAVAEAVIESSAGRALLVAHRRQLSTRLNAGPDETPDNELKKAIKEATQDKIREAQGAATVRLP